MPRRLLDAGLVFFFLYCAISVFEIIHYCDTYVFDARQQGVTHGVTDDELVGTFLREVEEAERVAAINITSVVAPQPLSVRLCQLELYVGVGGNSSVGIDGGEVEVYVGVWVVVAVADIETAEVGA